MMMYLPPVRHSYPSSRKNISSRRDGSAFVQLFSFWNMLVLSVKRNVNVVNLHAFRFCLKNLLILHPVIADRKPYQVTLGRSREKRFLLNREKKRNNHLAVGPSTSIVVWDVIFCDLSRRFLLTALTVGACFLRRLTVVYVPPLPRASQTHLSRYNWVDVECGGIHRFGRGDKLMHYWSKRTCEIKHFKIRIPPSPPFLENEWRFL